MADDERDNPGILLPPPLTYLLPLVFGLLLDRRSHLPFLPHSVAHTLGWPLLGGGVLLNGWFVFTMRRTDTPIDPRKPVSKLATSGPFRYTRNPAYLSMTTIYVGVAALRNALWAILFLPLVVYVIQRDQIEREEQYMERVFGKEYLNDKKSVRR
ncbi:MAG TPA: isoprenylcysteine carboxylmethyltransferase family protein [Rubrobacteraceae bacterium]|nr:isoprenylcysteine carboxylmethyltransferase family protein [Rubrobacteraceae bacterium]